MIAPASILISIPAGLRDPLLLSFQEVTKNYAEQRWEPAELNGGKFCECVFSIIDGALSGTFAAAPSKPSNMVLACLGLEKVPANPARVGDRSLRIQIPRMLLPLYEIRNNRGVGHAGGDINPNLMDASTVLAMTSWVLAELIRIFHHISPTDAQNTVDALVERKHPLVWKVGSAKRILNSEMPAKDQTLVLLHSEPLWVGEETLSRWVEYSSLASFRSRILKPLHDLRFIEFDSKNANARISPSGIKEVEERILKEWASSA